MPVPSLSLVVPTYNEADRLEEMVGATVAVLREAGIEAEVIVVDDNSPDGTGHIADALAAATPAVRVLHRPGKLGLGSAVIDGFAVATGGVLGVMDADLSHPPTVVPTMFTAMQVIGVDAVVASRYIPGGGLRNWPLRRRLLSRLGCLLARPLTPVRDATSGLFLVRREAVSDVAISAAGFKICLELLMRSRIASVAEVPYVFRDRAAGKSKMTVREALGYFRQLWNLYQLGLRPGAKARPVYHRLPTVKMETAAAGRLPATAD